MSDIVGEDTNEEKPNTNINKGAMAAAVLEFNVAAISNFLTGNCTKVGANWQDEMQGFENTASRLATERPKHEWVCLGLQAKQVKICICLCTCSPVTTMHIAAAGG